MVRFRDLLTRLVARDDGLWEINLAVYYKNIKKSIEAMKSEWINFKDDKHTEDDAEKLWQVHRTNTLEYCKKALALAKSHYPKKDAKLENLSKSIMDINTFMKDNPQIITGNDVQLVKLKVFELEIEKLHKELDALQS